MDRARRHWGILVALTVLATAGGCVSALTTAMYVLKGTNVDPEYKGMKGKRVAVVCRPLVNLKYQDSRVAKDLAHLVGKLLVANGQKVKLVDPRKVDRWVDENTWDEFPEIGKAVDAELVLGIDLEHFEIYQGQTLYQGKANTTLHVYDCQKEGEVAFEKTLPQSIYPPNTCIPTSEKQEAQFRREFLEVLADQIARHFYPHDPHADMAQDARAL